jgi:hypothetical protein
MAKKVITPKEVVKPKRVKPIIVETIHSTAEKAEKVPVFEKRVITGSLPVAEGCVRVIVLLDYHGMLDECYKGDIQDLPERRFKSLAFRGVVMEYKGDRIPNKQR